MSGWNATHRKSPDTRMEPKYPARWNMTEPGQWLESRGTRQHVFLALESRGTTVGCPTKTST